MSRSISSWTSSQRDLLDLEREEEKKQLTTKLTSQSAKECEKAGISILSLIIEEVTTSLYGRTSLMLQRRDKKILPNHNFKVGDEAVLRCKGRDSESSTVSGVVSKVSSTFIEMVSETYDEVEMEPPLRLDQLASEATYKKMKYALNDLDKLLDGPAWPIADTVFNDRDIEIPALVKIIPLNPNLNFSQVDAIECALGSKHIALIHGPPGTGKTTAVVELIKQAVLRQQRIICSAPSNVAVDNILEKLVVVVGSERPIRLVRLGHPARLSATTKKHCLEHLISIHENTEIVNEVRTDIDRIRKHAARAKGKSEKYAMYSELKSLRRELRVREEAVVGDIIKTSDVVLCTCVGASSRLLRNVVFDMCVIDEAAQALHVACWIPMLLAKKVVLAGDHHQLPPTVKSQAAETAGLADTLFEKLMVLPGGGSSPVARMLKVQYRMNDIISAWSSGEMYNNELISHETVARHDLNSLECIDIALINELGSVVMLLIDTAGCLMQEEYCEGGSHRNSSEANIVLKHVEKLVAANMHPSQIGVITPYNGQLEILKELMADRFPQLEIRTVDGFQGGEKEAIILTLVRSNDEREVGFLADRRRINVAVTRAKRHLAVVCDSDTCSSDLFLARLLDYISNSGEHYSAMEYEDSVTVSDLNTTFSMPTDVLHSLPEKVKSSSSSYSPDIANVQKKSKKVKGSLPSSISALPVSLLKIAANKEEIKLQSETLFGVLLKDFKESQHMTSFISGYVQIVELAQEPPTAASHDYLITSSLLELRVLKITKQTEIESPILIFPSTLSSYQRLKIHELAEIHGCFHESSGEGKDRVIKVSICRPSEALVGKKKRKEKVISDMKLEVANYADNIQEEDEEEEEEKESTDNQAVDMTTSTQIRKNVVNVKITCASNEDELELLDECIKANHIFQDSRKYRMQANVVPNPEKIKLHSKMQSILSLQEAKRLGLDNDTTKDVSTKVTPSLWAGKKLTDSKKKFLKPPPSFVGGKLGGSQAKDKKGGPSIPSREELAVKRLAALEQRQNAEVAKAADGINVKVLWNKVEYDIMIDTREGVDGVKTQLQQLTGVPNTRQKLMCKALWSGVVQNNADLSLMDFSSAQRTIMLMGSADVL